MQLNCQIVVSIFSLTLSISKWYIAVWGGSIFRCNISHLFILRQQNFWKYSYLTFWVQSTYKDHFSDLSIVNFRLFWRDFEKIETIFLVGKLRKKIQISQILTSLLIKPSQNKKGKKSLRYPTNKQSFSLEKDCFFVGYLKFFWPFLF